MKNLAMILLNGFCIQGHASDLPKDQVKCFTQKNCIKKVTDCVSRADAGTVVIRFDATITCVNADLKQTVLDSEVVEELREIPWTGSDSLDYCIEKRKQALQAWNMCH